MANENTVDVKFAVSAEYADAVALAKALHAVDQEQKAVAQSAKQAAADGKALDSHMSSLVARFKELAPQYKLTEDARKNATAQTVQFGEATNKATGAADAHTKTIHEAKEGQESIKDLSEGLAQVLEGNLTPGFINLTKAAKGFSQLGLAGTLGVVGAAVSAGIALWQAYKASVEAAAQAEKEAAAEIEKGTNTALASRIKGLQEANAEMEKSIQHSATMRGIESEISGAKTQSALADVDRRRDAGEISEFDAQRERADINFDAKSAQIGGQMQQNADALKAQRESVERSRARVAEAETVRDRQTGTAGEQAAQKNLEDTKAELQLQERKLAVLEKQNEALAAQSAAAKKEQLAELDRIKQAEGATLESNMAAIGAKGKGVAEKEAATRSGIAKRIADSDAQDKIDDAQMRQEFDERRRKEAEEAEEARLEDLRKRGIDPETMRRTKGGRTRSRPGAVDVTPESGFDDLLKRNKEAHDKNAAAAKQAAAAVDSAAGAVEGAFGSITSRLARLESQANFARTQSTS